MGQKHKRSREFRTPFPLRDIRKNPRSMYARVPQAMAQFVLKIEKFAHIMGTIAILRCPSLIMAPGPHSVDRFANDNHENTQLPRSGALEERRLMPFLFFLTAFFRVLNHMVALGGRATPFCPFWALRSFSQMRVCLPYSLIRDPHAY